MKELKFKNKDGFLSLYALSCGYLQTKEIDGKSVKLYMEGGCYIFQVICFDSNTSELIWETFDQLGPAKKRYKELIKKK